MQSVYSAAQADWATRTHVRGVLPFCRDAVGVFCSPSRLGQYHSEFFIEFLGSIRVSLPCSSPLQVTFSLCEWDLEYSECILWRGVSPPPTKKASVLSMRLNCIWWWGSSSRECRVPFHYHYSKLHRPEVLIPMGQIVLFKNYSYLMKLCATKPLKNNHTKNVNTNVQWTRFLNLLA